MTGSPRAEVPCHTFHAHLGGNNWAWVEGQGHWSQSAVKSGNEFLITDSFVLSGDLFPLKVICLSGRWWKRTLLDTRVYLQAMKRGSLHPPLPTPPPALHHQVSITHCLHHHPLPSRCPREEDFLFWRSPPRQTARLLSTEFVGDPSSQQKASTDCLCPMTLWIPVPIDPELWQVPAERDWPSPRLQILNKICHLAQDTDKALLSGAVCHCGKQSQFRFSRGLLLEIQVEKAGGEE